MPSTANHPLLRDMRKFIATRPPMWGGIDQSSPHFDVLAEFNHHVDRMRDEYVDTFGPIIGLESKGKTHPTVNDLAYAIADRDKGRVFDGIRMSEYSSWDRSPLFSVGRAYRRECGWDAAPGDHGIWILAARVTCSTMDDFERWLTGNLVGFGVVYDLDDDGKYESLVHLWTAKSARRQGVATRLIAEARRRFPLTVAEDPYTDEAIALLAKCWPEAIVR